MKRRGDKEVRVEQRRGREEGRRQVRERPGTAGRGLCEREGLEAGRSPEGERTARDHPRGRSGSGRVGSRRSNHQGAAGYPGALASPWAVGGGPWGVRAKGDTIGPTFSSSSWVLCVCEAGADSSGEGRR